jgi:exosortase/archaeosortase family protein
VRFCLLGAAPLFSLGANLIRIVVTGIIASRWGNLAANESLHWAWGVLVFMIAVLGLFGFQKLIRWAANENALQY